jgi:hypothetical protein
MEEQQSITASTLPRNFQFHEYTHEQFPRTPQRGRRTESEVPLPEPHPPRFIIRRKKRRSIMRADQNSIGLGIDNGKEVNTKPVFGLGLDSAYDDLLPSIEAPDEVETSRPRHVQPQESTPGFLSVFPEPRHMVIRTPSPQISRPRDSWSSSVGQMAVGQLVGTTSNRSLSSDSSDDSDLDSDDDTSYDGSMTSPDSDIGYYSQSTKSNLPITRLTYESPSPSMRNLPSQKMSRGKQPQIHWTADMDNHLWLCYLRYLNDPTVTPFKNWPGSSPPLGVCVRIAREAKSSWKGPKSMALARDRNVKHSRQRATSADTMIIPKSGSNTPTGSVFHVLPAWPKSSKSTRKRLRTICKNKTVMPPHYQRMLKSKSPEPFSSSSRGSSHRPRPSSPDFFPTREVRLSLATSTATTMQPDGPLQRLAREPARDRANSNWFNDLSVTWASPAAQPSSDLGNGPGTTIREGASDIPTLGPASVTGFDGASEVTRSSSPAPQRNADHVMAGTSQPLINIEQSSPPPSTDRLPVSSHSMLPLGSSGTMRLVSDAPPRLGSPFNHRHHHTWTASSSGLQRNRRATRPSINTAFASVPRLRSPFELHGTFPYPSTQKRRALNQLQEDGEGSPRQQRQSAERDPFYDPPPRRVRARGFSYGDALTQGRLPTAHTPPPDGPRTIHRFTTPPPHEIVPPAAPRDLAPQHNSYRRLTSPFDGISSRPSRARRASPTPDLLGLPDLSYPSIDEALNEHGRARRDN